MSAAQLDPTPQLEDEGLSHESAYDFAHNFAHESVSSPALQEHSALKEEVAARLAAHRARRQRNFPAPPAPTPIAAPTRARSAKIAAAVADRYARSESYRSFLAAEAQTAIRQAEAAAEVAAVSARAVTEAQLNLLAELDQWPTSAEEGYSGHQDPDHAGNAPPSSAVSPRHPAEESAYLPFASELEKPAPAKSQGAPRVTVRLYEEAVPHLGSSRTTTNHYPILDPLDEEDLALDDEIAFRQAPTFLASEPQIEIPANLIEFPRQLVAARRARPRLAEGPLREEGEAEQDAAQLRIFEVEPAHLSPAPALSSAAPEWTSILLDAHPLPAPGHPMYADYEPDYGLAAPAPAAPLESAAVELRLMAAAVDTCLVLAGCLAFATVASLTIQHLAGTGQHTASLGSDVLLNAVPALAKLPSGPVRTLASLVPFAVVAAATFALFFAAYQLLFFTFANATPGMTYARIGLCTFSDENPKRSQIRWRIPALALSACPLALGLIWTTLDSDRLSWHDRLTRTYQRSY